MAFSRRRKNAARARGRKSTRTSTGTDVRSTGDIARLLKSTRAHRSTSTNGICGSPEQTPTTFESGRKRTTRTSSRARALKGCRA